MNTRQPQTLEEVAQRKTELLHELRQLQETMKSEAGQLLAPWQPTSRTERVVHALRTGMAVTDGIRIGLKVMRGVRSMLRR